MGATGGQLLVLAGDAEVDHKTQEALVTMAKAVASATAALVTNAKNVAAKCDDQGLQNQVIMAAKQTALATQGLIACTKVWCMMFVCTYVCVCIYNVCVCVSLSCVHVCMYVHAWYLTPCDHTPCPTPTGAGPLHRFPPMSGAAH